MTTREGGVPHPLFIFFWSILLIPLRLLSLVSVAFMDFLAPTYCIQAGYGQRYPSIGVTRFPIYCADCIGVIGKIFNRLELALFVGKTLIPGCL
jgi:hypothetical protein